MSQSKPSKKHAVSHAKTATSETSVVHATPAASPEVSTPAPNLVTAPPAPAPVPPPFTPPGDLPPVAAVPAPRPGWEPTPRKRKGPQGLRPKATQAANASAVAKELTESATYGTDFGSRAPAAAQVAFVITNAAKWRETWQAAKKFLAYSAEQRATWDNEALVHMDKLKPAFDYVTSRDPTVAEKYAATSKYLGATNAIAARAATVRKANAKAKAKGTNGTATPSPAPVAPETPAVTAPAVK
jgi:hypothetical protein